jgi:hypothetical protein
VADKVLIADYDHAIPAEDAFDFEESGIDIRTDLDSLPADVASAFPDLYKTARDSEVPTQERKTRAFKSWRRARNRANKFEKHGHRPNANTISDVVDLAAVVHLAGFDAKTCRIVTTGYIGKRDFEPLESLDEENLTPEVLKEMGLRELEWDGQCVFQHLPLLFPITFFFSLTER